MDEEDESELLTLQMELENIEQKTDSIGRQINELLSKQEQMSEKKKKIQRQIKDIEKHGSQRTASVTEWNSDSFPWSVELKEMLLKHFHISNLRPLQKEAMNVTLSKEDCILIMPTGGGKSLTFQLPALISKGFTLVVSPLVSLMEDQVMALRKLNINAVMLSATTGTAHNSEVLLKMITLSSDMQILYVTPERLAKSKRFMSKLEKSYSMGNVNRIVIDEIHCASNWGHDFRPDYKILGILKRQFPNLPILGLTATASEKVLSDVKDILNMDTRCIVFRASFNRPNLFYEVYKTNLDQKALIVDIAKRIKLQFKNMSGIIYCFSRKDCEEVSSQLVDRGIIAHCYHSDMPGDLKTKVHEGWIRGSVQVVVATIAFGMGIDKPNVRFVIHFSISKSMENYYQESGRAGRDDLQSWCILYFRFQDIFRQCAMVFTEKTGLENLHHMIRYSVDRQKCRRTLIGKHFAEQWKASECKQMCDNCQRDPDAIKERSIFREAAALMDILKSAANREERLTAIKLIDLWLGKGKVRDRPKVLCSLPRDDCEDIVTKLLIEQILCEDFHFTPYNTITYILPGPRWPLLRHGKIDVKMAVLCRKKLTGTKPEENRNSTDTVVTNCQSPKWKDIDLNKSNSTLGGTKKKKNRLKSGEEIKNKSIDLTDSIVVKNSEENKEKTVLINSDSGSESESNKTNSSESSEKISKSSSLCNNKRPSASDEDNNATSKTMQGNLKSECTKKEVTKNKSKSCDNSIKKKSRNLAESNVVVKKSKEKIQKAVVVDSESDSGSDSNLSSSSESTKKTSKSSSLCKKMNTKALMLKYSSKSDVCETNQNESLNLSKSNESSTTSSKEKKQKTVTNGDLIPNSNPNSDSEEQNSSNNECSQKHTESSVMPISDTAMSSKDKLKSSEVEEKGSDSKDHKGKKRKYCFTDSEEET